MTNERNRPDLEDGSPAGIDHTDALLDEALRETFPASDPIAISAPMSISTLFLPAISVSFYQSC